MFNANLNTYQSSVSEENAYLQNGRFHSTLDSFLLAEIMLTNAHNYSSVQMALFDNM